MLKRIALTTALLLVTIGCAAKPGAVTLVNGFTLWEQTAPPLDRHQKLIIPGDSHAQYFAKLVKVSKIPVVLSEPDEDYEGYMGYNRGTFIWINSTLTMNGKVATLAHEIGHSFQPLGLDNFERDFFAEAVSNLYCQRIGLDVSHPSFLYLRNFAGPFKAFVLKYQGLIEAVVQLMVEGTK